MKCGGGTLTHTSRYLNIQRQDSNKKPRSTSAQPLSSYQYSSLLLSKYFNNELVCPPLLWCYGLIHSGRSGFKKAVNRAGTTVMMKTGHVEKTIDRDYEIEERRFRTMESAANRLQKEAKGYLDSLRGSSLYRA